MNIFLDRIIQLTKNKNMLWFEKEILENSTYTGICNSHIFRFKYVILKNKYIRFWILCRKIDNKDISCNWKEIQLDELEARELHNVVCSNTCKMEVEYQGKTLEQIKNRFEIIEYSEHIDYVAV